MSDRNTEAEAEDRITMNKRYQEATELYLRELANLELFFDDKAEDTLIVNKLYAHIKMQNIVILKKLQ